MGVDRSLLGPSSLVTTRSFGSRWRPRLVVSSLYDLVDASAAYLNGQSTEQVFAQRVRAILFASVKK